MNKQDILIIGGGPAGLTAAYELCKHNIQPLLLEKDDKVGGISRTEQYKGYRFDIGGHRFYTKIEQIQQLWEEMLGEEFIKVPRLSRIYYRHCFFNYPLSIFNTLKNLGLIESLLILLSYVKSHFKPLHPEDTFEQWVTNRFGKRLYLTFFKTYTEKVWGIPCDQIQADWAAQRIRGLSLKVAIHNALFSSKGAKSLIEEFHYPIHGPGMMWERFQQKIEQLGGTVQLNSKIVALHHHDGHIQSITVSQNQKNEDVQSDHVISSMPLSQLIFLLDPPAPEAVRVAAEKLKYRDFILVGLIIDHPNIFLDNWIYIHNPDVKVGRVQNFKNWSPAMVADPKKTTLGMEYFCNQGDSLSKMSDAALIQLATQELNQLDLAENNQVEDGFVYRQPKAYPVYDSVYRENLETIRDYLKQFDNLQTIGRNGMHRYNNQDHSMLTGMLAVRNLVYGEQHDLWEVNTKRSYYEEFTTKE